jgi:aminoglycoside phosphotransferase (APT) family kinase protein
MDIIRRWKVRDRVPFLEGRNSAFRAATYAAFGGYDATAQSGEDNKIGKSIGEIRGGRANRITYLPQAVLYTDPRRDLFAASQGSELAYQYSDFKGKNKMREFTFEELLIEAEKQPFNQAVIEKQVMGIFWALVQRKTDADPLLFKRACALAGVKVDVKKVKGSWECKVNDASGLMRGIKEQVFRELVKSPTESELGQEIIEAEPLMTGETNQAYKATLKNRRQVLVRAGHQRQRRFKTEANVMSRLKTEASVPVPTTHAIIPPNTTNPFAIQIMDFVENTSSIPKAESLASDPRRDQILSNTGRLLRQAHQLTTNGFGRLEEDGIRSNEHRTWSEVIIRKDVQPLIRRLEKLKVAHNPSLLTEAETILASHKAYLDRFTEPRLMLADFNNGNVLIKADGTVAAFIDIEAPKSGDPLFDLAYFAFINEDEVDLKAFYKGYGLTPEVYNSPEFTRKMKLYQVRIAIDSLWYSTWKGDNTKTSHAMKKLAQSVTYLRSVK